MAKGWQRSGPGRRSRALLCEISVSGRRSWWAGSGTRKAVPTFEQAAAAVIEQNAPTWTDPKLPNDWQNSLARYAFPCIGQLKVSDVEIQQVLEILQPIWHTRPETARRVR